MRLGTLYRTHLYKRLGLRSEGARVLDVGSFDGHWLSTQDAATRVSLDLDVQPNAETQSIRGSGLQLPFADAAFDTVFAFEVIEHVPNAEQLVAELVRVTRSHGRIFLSTPNADLRIFPPQLTAYAHHRWGHDACTGFTREQLERLFSAAGIDHVRVLSLHTRTYLLLYLPLSALFRLSRSLTARLVDLVARTDARGNAQGKHGYMLVEVER